MCAVFALFHASVAETPGALETDVAVPVAVVRERQARVTECAFLEIAVR